MEANFTFDILVLSPKSGWTSLQRCDNVNDARAQANKLAKDDRHEGVKITQEHFDYVENQFLEKTIFLHTRKGSKLPPREAEVEPYVPYDEMEGSGPDKSRVMIGIAAVSILLAIILGIGIYFFNDDNRYVPQANGEFFRYNLPTIKTNVIKDDRAYSLQISLQLELYRAQDAKDIEKDLGQIMEAVISHLQEIDPQDLNNSGRLQYLRAMLRRRIKESIGEVEFNDILFKDIQVRY